MITGCLLCWRAALGAQNKLFVGFDSFHDVLCTIRPASSWCDLNVAAFFLEKEKKSNTLQRDLACVVRERPVPADVVSVLDTSVLRPRPH